MVATLNPPHPGADRAARVCEALGLSVTEAAKAFGSTADTWLRMQASYDLAQSRKKVDPIHVQCLVPA